MILTTAILLNCIIVWWSRGLPNDRNGFSEDYDEVIANVAGFSPPQTFALCQGHLNYKYSTCNFFPGASHLLIMALWKTQG